MNRQGFAYLVAVLILGLLAFMGLFLAQSSSAEYSQAAVSVYRTMGRQLAEAAADEAYVLLEERFKDKTETGFLQQLLWQASGSQTPKGGGSTGLNPTLLHPSTMAEATTVQFPGLAGVLPGFGPMTPNDWGLGIELRSAKEPHWTGRANSTATYGHFGRAGTFLWVDPERDLALVCLTNKVFGDWAKTAWPEVSDAVIGSLPGTSPRETGPA